MQTPPGDSLFLVDTNVGASYVNGDVRERAQDVVTLGADGSATHDLTLTYDYPVVPHSWNDIYLPLRRQLALPRLRARPRPHQRRHQRHQRLRPLPRRAGPERRPLLLLLPHPRRHPALLRRRLLPVRHPHPAHAMDRSRRRPLRLRRRIAIPLFIQKQPGTTNAWDITIVPPDGAALALPDGSPLTLDGNGHAHYSSVLTRDLPLLVTLHS